MVLVSELDFELEDKLSALLLASAGLLDASMELDASIELDTTVALEVGLLTGGVVDSSFAAPPHAVR